jgi:stage IV sporulation protein B
VETEDIIFAFILAAERHINRERKTGRGDSYEMKKIKKIGAGLLLTVSLAIFINVEAAAQDLVPVGRAVGIRLDIDGVLVVGLAQLDEESGAVSPAGEAGVLPGDRIIRIGAEKIRGGEDLLKALEGADGGQVSLTVQRGERIIQYTVRPAQGDDGKKRLGLWLRDGITGIGTVTFYDPESGLFGALGHGVADMDTGSLISLGGGSITGTQVIDVLPGVKGTPGELCGSMDASQILGSIYSNTGCGIFGLALTPLSEREALPVAEESELSLGPATILSTIAGEEVREFQVEITRIYRGDDSARCLMLTITDKDLLAAAGGIVQGMSGSPILQNGKLVGAVTHVLVNDPTRGYGISLERMMTAAGGTRAFSEAA